MISDVRSLAFSLKLLSVSETLYPEGQTLATQKAVAEFLGTDNDVSIFPREGLLPPFVIVDTGEVLYCWVSGVHNLRQGLSVLVNASQQLETVDDWRSSPLFVTSGRAVFDQLRRKAEGPRRRWYLTGHSYGGGLLSVTALLLRSRYPDDEIQLCTFGSPRPGDDAMCRTMRSVVVRRWMNAADPVPRFPPHFGEAPVASVAAGFAIARTWGAYSQPRGGVVLYPDGLLATKALPPLVHPIQDALLVDWMSGVGGIQSAEHTLVTYRRNMTDALERTGQVAPLPLGSVGGDKGEQLSLEEFLRRATVAAASQGITASSEGDKVTYIPMASRTTVSKIGTEYAVLWGNGIIAAGKTLAGARAFKRDFNKALRSMQNLAFVNETALNAALADYLFAASTPGSGFEPILIIT